MGELVAVLILSACAVILSGYANYRLDDRVKSLETTLKNLERDHAKLSTLTIEWETVLSKLAQMAGRIDKTAATLRTREAEAATPNPNVSAQQGTSGPAARSRAQLLQYAKLKGG